MASRTDGRSRFGRRIMWLAVAIAVVALAYTAGWFYFARTLEQRAAATIAAINGGGVRAHCEEPAAHGFPYRIGLNCRSVFYENIRSGVSFRAGAFRSTATVYRPSLVIGELDGPASIVLPFGAAMEARWDMLNASARLARPLPERASFQGRNVTLAYEERGVGPLATAAEVQLHTRQLDADLDAAFSFRRLALGDEVVPGLPAFEGRGQATLDDGLAMLTDGPIEVRGRSANIRELVVGVVDGNAALTLSGPVAVGNDGLIDAELSIQVDDPAAVAQILAQIFPRARNEIMTAASALGGLNDASFQLRIARGRAFIGLIPVGKIPPV